MTDMRRTLLWVIFTMSLVLLWDAWNKHNGQPSFFGGAPRTVAAASAPGATPAPAAVPAPSTATVPGAPATVVATPAPVEAAPFRLNLFREGDFVNQKNLVQCVGASMQMTLNIIGVSVEVRRSTL